jgi:hypothetical protein
MTAAKRKLLRHAGRAHPLFDGPPIRDEQDVPVPPASPAPLKLAKTRREVRRAAYLKRYHAHRHAAPSVLTVRLHRSHATTAAERG